MITKQQAEDIAARFLGTGPGSDGGSWQLMEFEQGWVVLTSPPPGEEHWRGAATEVIERESGRIISFPSSIAAEDIAENYPAVRDWGHEVGASG